MNKPKVKWMATEPVEIPMYCPKCGSIDRRIQTTSDNTISPLVTDKVLCANCQSVLWERSSNLKW